MATKKKKDTSATSLDDVMAAANKVQGAGTIMMVGDCDLEVERIPCGVLSVDLPLGGGFPRGKISELYGAEASGKTSLSARLAANVQGLGLKVLYVDAENAMNLDMLRSAGVNLGTLAISQPGSGEQALEVVDLAVQADDVGLIVVDSVSALTPAAEIAGDMGDSHMALQARMMSQGMRKINSTMIAHNSQAIVVFINQIRATIGGFGGNVTSGGRALKFYSTVRLEVTRTGQIKAAGEDPHGHEVKIKVTKNRTAPPLRTGTFDMLYDRGISNGSAILDLGTKVGTITQSGAWYVDATTGEKIGNGRKKSIDAIEDNAELEQSLSEAITIAYNNAAVV